MSLLVATNLHDLQLLEALLYELLYPPRVLYALVFPEGVPRAPLRIFSEVVGGKLLALPQELPVLKSVRQLPSE
jgi:hypothetical protein